MKIRFAGEGKTIVWDAFGSIKESPGSSRDDYYKFLKRKQLAGDFVFKDNGALIVAQRLMWNKRFLVY